MKLYIIGNGFDLAHDIRSSYSDFGRFLEENYYSLKVQSEILYEDTDVSLWTDFETALGSIDINDIVRNVETEARRNNPDEIGHQSIYMSDVVSNACDSLKSVYEECFSEWVQQIDISSAKPFLHMDKNALYLTFNYTETLEDVYGIPENHICHIHNCRKYASPIVGHDETLFKDYNDEAWIAIDEIDDSLRHLFSITRKDVKSIIKKNNAFFSLLAKNKINKVCVYGHSLNDIDMPYLIEVRKNILSIPWTVSYYENDDQMKFKTKLHEKLGIPNHLIKMFKLEDK